MKIYLLLIRIDYILYYSLKKVVFRALKLLKDDMKFSCKSIAARSPRIHGGQNALIENYPYHVKLLQMDLVTQFCGGSIISKNWILTAGHCLAS